MTKKIYDAKRQGRGYKPNRFKRPPPSHFVQHLIVERIIEQVRLEG